jgi:conjugal transfer/type IV secretion protein DotA/TraY
MTVRSITFGDVLRYSLTPQILPRARELFGSGFGTLAFFIAQVYRAVRLLPDGHPFLNPVNIGRFGVMSVISAAWQHIWFNRRHLGQKNIDQIIVFIVILGALALLTFQFLILFMALAIPSAFAFAFPGGPTFANPLAMFDTPVMPAGSTLGGAQPFHDVAFMFLDRVFGVPGIFNSCISLAGNCVSIGVNGAQDPGMTVNDPATFPWPYHTAMQGMFQFYSVGLLVIAMFLFVYYTIVVVAETAQTGVPFGKRFNTLWAPIRFVMAAGLLIPISFGFNAAQFIVLYSAKWGSNFATNGWIGFNSQITGAGNTVMGTSANLIAKPQIPDMTELLHFFTVTHACKTIEDDLLVRRQDSYDLSTSDTVAALPSIDAYIVRANPAPGTPAYLSYGGSAAGTGWTGMSYAEAVEWSNFGDVVIRFGYQDAAYSNEKGTVKPMCGEVTIKTVCYPFLSGTSAAGVTAPVYAHEGCATVMQLYWAMLKSLWSVRGNNLYNGTYNAGGGYPAFAAGGTTLPWNISSRLADPYVERYVYRNNPSKTTVPTPADRQDMIAMFNDNLNRIVDAGVTAEQGNASTPFQMTSDLLARGWAAAGIWYNRIAEVNGTMTVAVWNLPVVSKYPWAMTQVAEAKAKGQVNNAPGQIFNPYVQNQRYAINFERGADEAQAADAYWVITDWWQAQETGFTTSTRALKTGNVVLDIINWMFGTSGLFSIRENANVHPLAQLSSIGKSLIERSISLLGYGLAGTFAQSLIGGEGGALGAMKQVLGVVTGFAFSILSIGASAGFILYYIIPFLPFIYYFFAVAGWVKAIFEAMVGVPLWALAHLRIDGDGLPGDAAMGGYYLILEIMLRPILIVFGLVASVAIYAASVQVLNDIFNLAVANVSGIDMQNIATTPFTMDNLRGTIDTFFFTILYVILVYMLGMSAFKLIDLIPSSMLRWLGSGAQAFGADGREGADAAGALVGYGLQGSNMAFGDLSRAAQGAASGMGGLANAGVNMIRR